MFIVADRLVLVRIFYGRYLTIERRRVVTSNAFMNRLEIWIRMNYIPRRQLKIIIVCAPSIVYPICTKLYIDWLWTLTQHNDYVENTAQHKSYCLDGLERCEQNVFNVSHVAWGFVDRYSKFSSRRPTNGYATLRPCPALESNHPHFSVWASLAEHSN